VDKDGRYFVDQQPVLESELLIRVQAALDRKLERIVLIKADTDATYGDVMALLDQLQRAGIEDIGLVTERRIGGRRVGGN
jgi:biopolymer transport protein ExbD